MLNRQELEVIRLALNSLKQEGCYWGVQKHFNNHLNNAMVKIDVMEETLYRIEREKKEKK